MVVRKPIIRRLTRRRAMQGMSAALGSAAMGACGSTDGDGGGSTSSATGSTGGDGGTSSGPGMDASSSGGVVGSDCSELSDLPPDQLLAPIETIVVVMMENRSFDHYFGSLSLVEGASVDGLTGAETNPDAGGSPVGVFQSDALVINDDPPHGWDESHDQWNNGANDGFVTEYIADNATDPSLVMGYHVREQLPVIYALADNYVLCEQWYASVMGPTWPNRFYLHLGTSNGQMANEQMVTPSPSIFDRLDDAGVSNLYFNSSLPVPVIYGKTEGIEQIEQFFTRAAEGTLPAFCMVDPTFTALGTLGNDDHPPADIRMGQAFLASIYSALAQSPQWDRCLLIITYDEHGGFYDHVSPPTTVDELVPFQQLGFRVPSLVIGPHVRRGCVSSQVFEHASALSTVTRRFGLTPLNDRVDQAADVSSALDPAFLDAPQPPIELPPVELTLPPHFRDPRAKTAQIELVQRVRQLGLPRRLDRGAETEEILRRTLRFGERLGAVKIRRS